MKSTLQKTFHFGGSLLLITLAAGLAFAAQSSPALTKSEAKHLIATASTPEDYQKLAAYFTQKAVAMDAEAAEHAELAKEYAKNPHDMKNPTSAKTEQHCKYFEQAAQKAATEDRAMAASFENMATNAKK